MIKKEKYNLVFQKVTKKFNIKYIWLLAFSCWFLAMPIYAQKFSKKKQELEQKRKELQQKIEETKKVLEETKKKQNTSLQTLNTITAQIKTREKVINNIGQQIFELALEIDESKKQVEVLKADVANLKKDYADNILLAYKSHSSIDKIIFIFNSQSFNQAVKRIKYLQQFNDYRRQQAQLILNTQKAIIETINEMIALKRQKMDLAGIKEEEKKELEVDKKEENQVLTQLSAKETQLRKEIANNEKAAKNLSKALAQLIAKEIEEARMREEARRRAEEERLAKLNAKKNGTTVKKDTKKTEANTFVQSPESLKLSNDFVSNKGRLPWPVDNGYISVGFGTHKHPTLKGIETTNNGVNIAVRKGSSARAVLAGIVRAVLPVSGMEMMVLINHGEYFSVYANIQNVSVKIGEKVSTKQNIGEVYTDEQENKTEIHFEIYKQRQKQNPELWLRD